jgi:hypothetical protein
MAFLLPRDGTVGPNRRLVASWLLSLGRRPSFSHTREQEAVMWIPPPPESAGEDRSMPESRARLALGDRYALWKRLGPLAAKHDDISWVNVWDAATKLMAEGHGLRDRHIIERARELAGAEAAYWQEFEDRQQQRRDKRREGSTDGSDTEAPSGAAD